MRLTKIFIAIFAPDERLQSSATLLRLQISKGLQRPILQSLSAFPLRNFLFFCQILDNIQFSTFLDDSQSSTFLDSIQYPGFLGQNPVFNFFSTTSNIQVFLDNIQFSIFFRQPPVLRFFGCSPVFRFLGQHPVFSFFEQHPVFVFFKKHAGLCLTASSLHLFAQQFKVVFGQNFQFQGLFLDSIQWMPSTLHFYGHHPVYSFLKKTSSFQVLWTTSSFF